MEKVVIIPGENGVEYSASLTAEEADFYLRLAQWRTSSDDRLMQEFGKLIMSKQKRDTQQNKDQYN